MAIVMMILSESEREKKGIVQLIDPPSTQGEFADTWRRKRVPVAKDTEDVLEILFKFCIYLNSTHRPNPARGALEATKSRTPVP